MNEESYTKEDYRVEFNRTSKNKIGETIHIFNVHHVPTKDNCLFRLFANCRKVENNKSPFSLVPIEIKELIKEKAIERGL